jgi:hypothetical protein
VRNYVRFFAISHQYWWNGDPGQGTFNSDFIGTSIDDQGDPLSLYQQFIDELAYLQNLNPEWQPGMWNRYLTGEELPYLTPDRYYFTLDKPHLIKALSLLGSQYTFYWQRLLDYEIIVTESPRDTWSHGE